MEKAPESPRVHWEGSGAVGDGADKEVYTANVYITNDWQFRVSSQFHCCSSPKGAKQRKRERRAVEMGHAGLEAVGWARSDKPPSFFVVFQVQ